MSRDALVIWTVYDHPRDEPDAFVARRFVVMRDGRVGATDDTMTEADIETLRKYFRAAGLVCFARHETDDPVIVETWL